MKHPILTTLALLSLGTLGCGASVKGSVQVYTGDVSSVQTPASSLTDLHVARSIAEDTRGELQRSAVDASTSVTDLKQKLDEAAAALAAIAKDSTYGDVFKGYKAAYLDYVAAVAKADAKTPAQLFSLPEVKKAMDALRAQLNGVIAEKNKQVLARPFYGALLEKAGAEADALGALDAVVCLSCSGGSGGGAGALSPDQVKLFTGNGADAALKKLETSLKGVDAPKLDGLTGEKNGRKAIESLATRIGLARGALEGPALQDAWKEVDAAMIAAEKALTSVYSSHGGASGEQVAQNARDASAIAHARLRAYAGEFEKIQLDAGKIAADLRIVGAFFEQPEVASLIKEPPNLMKVGKTFDGALDLLKKSPERIRVSATLVGKPGFDATDPNVSRLDEELWKDAPVDAFTVKANGDSDFVVVQESPTRFTVKQLRFDPKANAELGVTIADLGLNIVSTIVQQTTGVKVGLTGEGGSAQGATGDARKRIGEDCRAQVRVMSASLSAEIDKVQRSAGAVEPALQGRIRGLLAGHHATLAACTGALGKPASTPPSAESK